MPVPAYAGTGILHKYRLLPYANMIFSDDPAHLPNLQFIQASHQAPVHHTLRLTAGPGS